MNNRIEFIDLAKGICILLVISNHVDQGDWLYSNENIEDYFYSFRMPLYFFLSGIFISFKNGYKDFLNKKINKLLIPFIFFVVLTNLYNYTISILSQWEPFHLFNKEFLYTSPLYFALTENENYRNSNVSLWFLVSLFTTYMLYALLHRIFSKQKRTKYILPVSWLIGIVGFYLSKYNINIPCYIDSSFTCLPFVCTGVFLRKRTNILAPAKSRTATFALSLLCLIITYFLSSGKREFYIQYYETNLVSLYCAGISGAIGILLLAKAINKLPLISYIGRYSIVPLGVHLLPFNELKIMSYHLFSHIYSFIIFTFVCTLIFSYVSIKLLVKYLPFCIAQKDLLHIDFGKHS